MMLVQPHSLHARLRLSLSLSLSLLNLFLLSLVLSLFFFFRSVSLVFASNKIVMIALSRHLRSFHARNKCHDMSRDMYGGFIEK